MKVPITEDFIKLVYNNYILSNSENPQEWLSKCATELNTSWDMVSRAFAEIDTYSKMSNEIKRLNNENESLKNEIKRLNNLIHTEP